MGKFNQSKYCYPNSTILINKFDVHDQQKLDQLEAYYVGRRLFQLRENPLRGKLYIEEQGKELFKELKKIRNFSHELYNLQECTDSSSFIEVENYKNEYIHVSILNSNVMVIRDKKKILLEGELEEIQRFVTNFIFN